MVYVLILATFLASAALTMLCLAGAALAGATLVAQMSTDDAMTLLHATGAVGAAAMAFWAPRTRVRAFASRLQHARNTGRVLGTVLLAYGLIWAGYLVERSFDASINGPSRVTVLLAMALASALFAIDWARGRDRNVAAKP